jgi:D-aminopeptidase
MSCRRVPGDDFDPTGLSTYDVRVVGDIVVDELFDAVIEATEEAIVNALVAATTVVGRDSITAHAIPHERLVEVMRAAGR